MKLPTPGALLPVLLICLCSACSESTQPALDQGLDRAPLSDMTSLDMHRHEASVDAAGDGRTPETGPDGSCNGTCAQQTLVATFGTVTEPLERSIYGLDKDAQGAPGVYLEALHGGFSGCPEESSPAPDRTLILSGLPLPTPGATVTKEDGLVVSLLDYQGTLLKNSPLAKATAAVVTFVAADVCTSCVGQPTPAHPAGFVALEIEATFDEGVVKGHLYATHCDSLDL